MKVSVAESSASSSFELTFAPQLEAVAAVKKFITEYFERVFSDPESAARLELATHELVENAVKGTAHGTVRIAVEFTRAKGSCEVGITTWNCASGWNIACLQKAISDLSDLTDGAARYLELTREATALHSGEGLGLGRISGEGGMQLECEITGDLVCVLARVKLPLPEASS